MAERRRRATLERELVHARPRPRDGYVVDAMRLFSHESPTRRKAPGRRARRIAALTITAMLVAGLALLGGLSHARLTASHAASALTGVVKRAFDVGGAGSSASRDLASDCVHIRGASDTFDLSVSSPQKAGRAFSVSVIAVQCGVSGNTFTDTSYAGTKAIIFSGPSSTPSGAAPAYPGTVTFTDGVGSATITLPAAAASTTLEAADGLITGSATLSVDPA